MIQRMQKEEIINSFVLIRVPSKSKSNVVIFVMIVLLPFFEPIQSASIGKTQQASVE